MRRRLPRSSPHDRPQRRRPHYCRRGRSGGLAALTSASPFAVRIYRQHREHARRRSPAMRSILFGAPLRNCASGRRAVVQIKGDLNGTASGTQRDGQKTVLLPRREHQSSGNHSPQEHDSKSERDADPQRRTPAVKRSISRGWTPNVHSACKLYLDFDLARPLSGAMGAPESVGRSLIEILRKLLKMDAESRFRAGEMPRRSELRGNRQSRPMQTSARATGARKYTANPGGNCKVNIASQRSPPIAAPRAPAAFRLRSTSIMLRIVKPRYSNRRCTGL